MMHCMPQSRRRSAASVVFMTNYVKVVDKQMYSLVTIEKFMKMKLAADAISRGSQPKMKSRCYATFAVCPRRRKVLQLRTIMAQVDNTTLPIAWALIERKSYGAHVSVLQHFSTVLASHIWPTLFMTDFETNFETDFKLCIRKRLHKDATSITVR